MRNIAPERIILTILFITTVVVIGCSSDPTGPEVRGEPADLTAVINNAGDWENETPLPESREPDGAPETTPFEDGTIWSCTSTQVNLEQAPESFLLNASFPEIWPGSVLQGNSLADDPPTAVRPRRGNGGVTIDIITGETETNSAVFDEVTKPSMVEALNAIIANRDILPKRFTFSVTKVDSRESMRLAMGVKVSTFASEFEGKMNFNTDRNYTRYVISLVQPFYVMEFNAPTRLSDWFHEDVTTAELGQDMGPGNPPVYVSTVTYGRKVNILVESTSDESEMRSELDIHYNAVTDVDATIDLELTERVENLHIVATVWGGDAPESAFTNPSATSVQDLMGATQTISTGLMLSYTLKDIKNGETVKVKMGTEYTVNDCIPLGVGMENKMFAYSADDVDVLPNFFWKTPSSSTFQRYFAFNESTQRFMRGDGAPCHTMTLVTGWPADASTPGAATLGGGDPHTRPQLLFDGDSPTQSVGKVVQFMSGFGLKTGLTIPGEMLVDKDYTMFFVMSGGRGVYGLDRKNVFCQNVNTPGGMGPYDVTNHPNTVMYAPAKMGPGFEGSNLMLGWSGNNFIWEHSGEIGGSYPATELTPSREYKVYCVRYVQNHAGGLKTSIFVNGILEKELSEGELDHINQLSGLVLGANHSSTIESGTISTIRLRMFEGYEGAVTDELIAERSSALALSEHL